MDGGHIFFNILDLSLEQLVGVLVAEVLFVVAHVGRALVANGRNVALGGDAPGPCKSNFLNICV